MTARSVSVIVGAAAALVVSFRLLVGLLKRKTYDGLSGVVSWSSKVIAAARALETQEEHPLVVDPLAEALAGPEALADCRKRALEAPPDSGRRYKVGKAIRTRWFDDQIEAALGMPVATTIPGMLRAPTAPPRIDLPSYVWSHPSGQEPRQLVMLGAGMDTRPWRMKLPADLHWFELDQADVVQAKQQLLRQAAAELPGRAQEMLGEDQPGTPLTPSRFDSGLARHTSIDSVRYPLRCASWTGVPCNLSDASWPKDLQAAGFDPRKPTIWVAEGLLMYIEGPAVRFLLAQMAELSAEGSVAAVQSFTEDVLERVRARTDLPSGSLMKSWVFGCPADPTEFLASCGWRLQLRTDRAGIANSLGLDVNLCSFTARGATVDPKPGGSLFLVATPAAKA